MARQPRGIRNNNPGNIRHGSNWQGLAAEQPDSDFCTFTEPVWGLRALAKLLLTYQRKYGLNTLRGIITRYAPAVENDTSGYIDHVARRLGVEPDSTLDVSAHLEGLMQAIVAHENGAGWARHYPESLYGKAADMARQG